VHAADCILR